MSPYVFSNLMGFNKCHCQCNIRVGILVLKCYIIGDFGAFGEINSFDRKLEKLFLGVIHEEDRGMIFLMHAFIMKAVFVT